MCLNGKAVEHIKERRRVIFSPDVHIEGWLYQVSVDAVEAHFHALHAGDNAGHGGRGCQLPPPVKGVPVCEVLPLLCIGSTAQDIRGDTGFIYWVQLTRLNSIVAIGVIEGVVRFRAVKHHQVGFALLSGPYIVVCTLDVNGKGVFDKFHRVRAHPVVIPAPGIGDGHVLTGVTVKIKGAEQVPLAAV